MVKRLTISVCMITYAHEKFIEQAIKSVLEQNCDFDIELIISNDFSPDSTDSIIAKLISKLNKNVDVKYFNHSKNLGIIPNFLFALRQCSGKYIAICDGDDYWNDPLKLQKQVDFLELNKDYVMSCHNTSSIDENGRILNESYLLEKHKQGYTQDELIKGALVMPLTMCFRNVITKYPKEFYKVVNGDVFLISLLGNYGKCKFQPEVLPSAYRFHANGVCSLASLLVRTIQWKNTYLQLFNYYKRTNNNAEIANHYWAKYKKAFNMVFLENIKNRDLKKAFLLYSEICFQSIKYFNFKQILYTTIDAYKYVFKY